MDSYMNLTISAQLIRFILYMEVLMILHILLLVVMVSVGCSITSGMPPVIKVLCCRIFGYSYCSHILWLPF